MNHRTSADRIPTIFVSSTCYDLSQVRADLREFIKEQLGYEALLSEANSFPVAPQLSSVENCIRVVRERADILILVIGCRYGSITNSGKSVTNLEYIEARAKNIPIYAFVDTKILNLIPTWKKNPTADFSNTVDTTDLFEFVDSFRSIDSIWVSPFENAQNIISTLQNHFGYLFYNCLKFYHQSKISNFSQKVLQLKGKALRIAIEQQAMWEYSLFGELVKSELENSMDLKRDLLHGITFSKTERLYIPSEIFNFISEKIDEITEITGILGKVINEALSAAVGAPGEDGNADYIIYAAERLGMTYKAIINWGMNVNSLRVPHDFNNLLKIFSKAVLSSVEDIEKFSKDYEEQIKSVQSQLAQRSDEIIHFKIHLTLSPPNLSEYEREGARLAEKYRAG